MTRMTVKDFDQDLLDLYDFYAHGKISKREFLDKAGRRQRRATDSKHRCCCNRPRLTNR